MSAQVKDFDYKRYLASREWALLREQIRQRSEGRCERCLANMASVHHLTYERIGHERLEDLLAVCDECHRWLSGKSNRDPAKLLLLAGYARLRCHLYSFLLYGKEDSTVPWSASSTCYVISLLEGVVYRDEWLQAGRAVPS